MIENGFRVTKIDENDSQKIVEPQGPLAKLHSALAFAIALGDEKKARAPPNKLWSKEKW